ncbi:uroporphyrinogen decarboxylase family protein, partial [Helicobacter bizzozeronii]|uniref:uroporphyrinogen decarboxylase family protein n=1 Tax=Helicobacter bizzozeronii TaxID=56877 RepID=UPI002491B049
GYFFFFKEKTAYEIRLGLVGTEVSIRKRRTPLDLAKRILGDRYVLQGNLEPARLYDRDAMLEGVERILKVVDKQAGFIFNLGHGMIKDLPRENALELVKFVQTQTAR